MRALVSGPAATPAALLGPGLTLSWLNLSRSLSQLPVKEDNRRRCSERRSEPARVEACGCAGMLMPCPGW